MLGESVISSNSSISMPNCNHEEADTRILVHLLHALEGNAETVLVRTVDTDVVIILVGKFYDLIAASPGADIWVAFGMGKYFSFISINLICASLGKSKSQSLPVLHAFSGCDTTSSFNGKGKKSVWQAWQEYQDVTPSFEYLANNPFQRLDSSSQYFQSLERFTVILYDKTSPLTSINEARMSLFCKNNKAMDKLPPSQVILYLVIIIKF